jgi:hypothetical protein
MGAINSGLESGVNALNGRTDRSGAMLDQQGGLYGNLQMDPSYGFRLNEGLDAVQSRLAAAGGRNGGAAMKAINDYAQNFASTEYGNAANRRLNEFGASQGADAQSLAAQGQLAGLYGNAASQAGGMAYGAGQQGANIYGQGASQMANIYGQTGQQLGAQAANAGQTLGGMTQDYYGQLANSQYGLAQQMGQNVMQGANAASGMTNAAIANNNSMVPYAGLGWTAAANGVNGLGDAAVTILASKAKGGTL